MFPRSRCSLLAKIRVSSQNSWYPLSCLAVIRIVQGALLFRSTKRRNDLCSFAADTDGNNQAVFSQNNRIHLHPHWAVCNCFNIQSDTHETQLHLLCHQPGTASPVHIYSWHGNQKIHDPGDLTVVQKRAALVQKFLVSIEFRILKSETVSSSSGFRICLYS